MRFIIFIIIVCFIASFCSCTKQDYSYLNTDRRAIVIRVSERYTIKWSLIRIINDTLDRNTRASDYAMLKPDTLISACSIDKIDSNFRIEVRKFIVK